MYRGLAALTMQPLPLVVSPEFFGESWLVMVTVISIRHDLPEDKMVFPSARRMQKNNYFHSTIFPLFVYDEFYMLNSDRTSVRYVKVPKS